MKESIRTIIHNDKVVVLVNGRITADFPPEVARQLAAALLQQAKLIENEKRNRDDVLDQAVLMRAGANIGLMNNPKSLNEALKEAQWNRDLRRFMKRSTGIKSNEVFGIPIIRGGT